MSSDTSATVSIVEADADLADLLAPDELERARHEARAAALRLWPGDWDAAASALPERHHRGFLITEGLLSRDVQVIGRQCVELLGHGDVLRPWTWDGEGSHVHAEIGWTVLEPTCMAILDQRLVTRIAPWPQLGVELFGRATRRAHALAVSLAISYHQRVDDRLMLMLWHLAERWGRVHPDGIVVPLPLSHQRLADLVGAHRPAVTTALGKLTQAGSLTRRENGNWVLHGEPPRELRHHRLAGVGASEPSEQLGH